MQTNSFVKRGKDIHKQTCYKYFADKKDKEILKILEIYQNPADICLNLNLSPPLFLMYIKF